VHVHDGIGRLKVVTKEWKRLSIGDIQLLTWISTFPATYQNIEIYSTSSPSKTTSPSCENMTFFYSLTIRGKYGMQRY